ncbi:MAG: glycosyltransferase family protein [Deltaproteobacteria bacterium]|nr:glycosyltransferase family protein [Deltaproteobacteria bacterium]MBW2063907.1 glycosyltransferase family protein [Deltaproteobacteria bacterium]
MATVAIVQARMGSKRFPGKVLEEIGGVPMLWHTFQRIRKVPEIDDVVLATSKLGRDDPLVRFAERESISVFRGSEEDVLERYYMTAKEIQAETIVRITGDCPFIDPAITRRTVKLFLENRIDYSSNTIERTFPRGTDTEVFSFDALERAYHEGSTRADREHVTHYIVSNTGKFRVKWVKSKKNLSYIRHCVDVKQDYLFAKALFFHLAFDNIFFTTEEVEALLKRLPWLMEINAHVCQKEL